MRVAFEACVGPSLEDAWFLLRRFEVQRGRPEVADWDRCEHWIGRVLAGEARPLWATRAWVGGLAAGRAGDACAIVDREATTGLLRETSGLLHLRGRDALAAVPHAVHGATLHGIRALGDGTWVAWSETPTATSRVVTFDGDAVSVLPSPPLGELSRVDGPHARLLLAGSRDGCAALWDGARWSPPLRVGEGELWSALLRSVDEGYAALFPPGHLAAWDGHRWHALTRCDGPVVDLAWSDGALVLADGASLRRWDHGGFSSYDPRDDAPGPPARGDAASPGEAPHSLHRGDHALLTTSEGAVAEYVGRVLRRRLRAEALGEALAARRPLWETEALESDPAVYSAPVARGDLAASYGTKLWFEACVGEGFDDAHFLCARSAEVERYAVDEADWVVGRIRDGVVTSVTTTRVVLRGLQRVASGRCYVAAFSDRGGVWRTPPDGSLQWERLDVPAMQGLFALDDACVMCWGGRGEGQRFFLLDERGAREIAAPPSRVVAVHGSSPDWIVAVGHDGLLARWDGAAWHPWSPVIAGMIGSVHVVSPERMYATGPCGALLEGSRFGWAERAPTSGAATQVVVRGEEVYVADPLEGLLRLSVDTLVPVDLPVWPAGLCAGREALLATERDGFTEVRGLERCRRITGAELHVALRNHPALWR